VKELLTIRLRLLKGIFLSELPNLPLESIETLQSLTKEGFLEQSNDHFKLSEKGKLFYDFVASELV
jgi:coproporphyrinogen III oxidase-like Fe-S oxidoreductase